MEELEMGEGRLEIKKARNSSKSGGRIIEISWTSSYPEWYLTD